MNRIRVHRHYGCLGPVCGLRKDEGRPKMSVWGHAKTRHGTRWCRYKRTCQSCKQFIRDTFLVRSRRSMKAALNCTPDASALSQDRRPHTGPRQHTCESACICTYILLKIAGAVSALFGNDEWLSQMLKFGKKLANVQVTDNVGHTDWIPIEKANILLDRGGPHRPDHAALATRASQSAGMGGGARAREIGTVVCPLSLRSNGS